MPPRSPLPQRHGLDAAWIRTPGVGPGDPPRWATMGDFLHSRLPARAGVADMLAAGTFVDKNGRSLDGSEPFAPHTFVWFHRPLAPEEPVPFPLTVLDADEHVVVVDKPHFMATTPRGAHVQETALIKARVMLDLPELAPAHRLDRLTAGVLVFTTRREYRGAYAGVFQEGLAHKEYEAIAPYDASLEFPRRVVNRIEKRRDRLQAEVVRGEPNAATLIEVMEVHEEYARYRLTPRTGKTHQLRVHMAGLGLPIAGDSLYPEVRAVEPGDFSDPLRLVARLLSFTDPLTGAERDYTSAVTLDWPSRGA